MRLYTNNNGRFLYLPIVIVYLFPTITCFIACKIIFITTNIHECMKPESCHSQLFIIINFVLTLMVILFEIVCVSIFVYVYQIWQLFFIFIITFLTLCLYKFISFYLKYAPAVCSYNKDRDI